MCSVTNILWRVAMISIVDCQPSVNTSYKNENEFKDFNCWNWFSVLYYIRLHMCVRNTYNFIKNNSPVQINKYRITDMFIKSDWLFGRLFTLKVIFVIYEMLNKIQDACL